MHYQKITYKQASEKYKDLMDLIPSSELYSASEEGQDVNIAVFDGDIELDEIDNDCSNYFIDLPDSGICCIIVRGNLSVKKYINLRHSDVGIAPHLLVTGNLKADAVFINGGGFLYVGEDLKLARYLFIDDGAFLAVTCKGSVSCDFAFIEGQSDYSFNVLKQGIFYIHDYTPDYPYNQINKIENKAKVIRVLNEQDVYFIEVQGITSKLVDADSFDKLHKIYAIFEDYENSLESELIFESYKNGNNLFRLMEFDNILK